MQAGRLWQAPVCVYTQGTEADVAEFTTCVQLLMVRSARTTCGGCKACIPGGQGIVRRLACTSVIMCTCVRNRSTRAAMTVRGSPVMASSGQVDC
eukprot:1545429-Pleurochrysis_carterae.AAC.5